MAAVDNAGIRNILEGSHSKGCKLSLHNTGMGQREKLAGHLQGLGEPRGQGGGGGGTAEKGNAGKEEGKTRIWRLAKLIGYHIYTSVCLDRETYQVFQVLGSVVLFNMHVAGQAKYTCSCECGT